MIPPRTATFCAGFIVLAACLSAAASGQEPDTKYSSLSKVENAPDIRDLRQRLRDGGPFDANVRDLIIRVVVPQLAFEANRPTIERVRRRIRDLPLGDITDDKAFDDAAKVMLGAVEKLARDTDAEPVVRVNAMLLVGELRSKDDRPLAAALAPLVAAAGDARLPMEVRIAAATGVARHADAVKSGGDATAVARAVGPGIAPMLSGAPSPAADWLAGRALAIVQSLGPKAATPESLAAISRLLEDQERAVDLRVRAAAALGAAATADAGVDVDRAVAAIKATAAAGLVADRTAADDRRLEQQLGGAEIPPAGQQPGGAAQATIPKLACQRNAWRLWTCADALASEDGGSGLAKLLSGEAAAAAGKLAATLREAAKAIDANPDEQSIREALERIDGKATSGGREPPPAPRPVEPTPTAGGSPFDSQPAGR